MIRPLVMKFGGTSVAGAAAMSNVARIVGGAADQARPVLVVVSAMSGVTDALLAACRGGAGWRRRIGRAPRRATRVAPSRGREAAVRSHTGGRATLRRKSRATCDELRGVLTSVAILQELTPRGADRVTAAGELLSSRIVAALLARAGCRRDGSMRAVASSPTPPLARPCRTSRRRRSRRAREIGPAWEAGEIAVAGGFVGATRDGITTTLGRGGSDVSAAVFGSALDAEEIQIWTDVDGMLTADPRVIADAQPVSRLSFDEAAELAYFGAKVLHPSTILPAVEKNIPVRILNTMRPEPARAVSSPPTALSMGGL